MAQIKFVTPTATLNMLQLSLLITGLKFEGSTGMLMTSPRKVNSAQLAKDFLGIDRKSKVDKTVLAAWLQSVKDFVKANPDQEIDIQKIIHEKPVVSEKGVTLLIPQA